MQGRGQWGWGFGNQMLRENPYKGKRSVLRMVPVETISDAGIMRVKSRPVLHDTAKNDVRWAECLSKGWGGWWEGKCSSATYGWWITQIPVQGSRVHYAFGWKSLVLFTQREAGHGGVLSVVPISWWNETVVPCWNLLLDCILFINRDTWLFLDQTHDIVITSICGFSDEYTILYVYFVYTHSWIYE